MTSEELLADREAAIATLLAKIAALDAAIVSAVCHGCGHKTIHDGGVAIHWCEECVAGKVTALEADLADKDAKLTDGESSWDFACRWYKTEVIASSIKRRDQPIPKDVSSHEFAVWMCEQYRLAMNKGIQIGLGSERTLREQAQADAVAESVGATGLAVKCARLTQECAAAQADAARLRQAMESLAEERHMLHGGKPDAFWNCSANCCRQSAEHLRSTNAGQPLLDELATLRAELEIVKHDRDCALKGEEELESELTAERTAREQAQADAARYRNALYQIGCGKETWTREQMIDVAVEQLASNAESNASLTP